SHAPPTFSSNDPTTPATSTLSLHDALPISTGQWIPTGSMNVARIYHYAVLLANGQVLVLFGSNGLTGTGLVTTTELYDPVTGNWTVDGSTGSSAQFGFSVTLLNTGKVLIAGGANCVYP